MRRLAVVMVLLMLLSACTVKAAPPTPRPSGPVPSHMASLPPATDLEARVEALEKIVVFLNKRLEVHMRDHPHRLSDVDHTHMNDHYHSSGDNFLDEGYHTHFEYAEQNHEHWGYAEEFHSHDRGW